jgi:excisionase family DNA binding protein
MNGWRPKMSALTHRQQPPTAHEAAAARISGRLLAVHAREHRSLTVHIADTDQNESIELPAGAVVLLVDILEAMAAGRSVTLLPESAELTTVQAAGVLNVSRPYLIKLLDENAIPHRKVGTHRRIRMEDVIAYKERIDQQREAVLEQLTLEAQEQGDGY